MEIIILFILLALLLAVLVMQILWRPPKQNWDALNKIEPHLDQLQSGQVRQEEILRAELGQSRLEAANHSKEGRTELAEMLQRLSDSWVAQLTEIQKNQIQGQQAMATFLAEANTESRDVLERSVKAFQTEMATKLDGLQRRGNDQFDPATKGNGRIAKIR
jgi:DNA anti-recombination protein RmuC